jgi:hypothetical protein
MAARRGAKERRTRQEGRRRDLDSMAFCPREAVGVASVAKMPLRKTRPKARRLTHPAVRLQRGAILSACARVFASLFQILPLDETPASKSYGSHVGIFIKLINADCLKHLLFFRLISQEQLRC